MLYFDFGAVMKIGEVIKKLRLIYGYKAAELSRRVDISASYLSEIEHGSKIPTLDLLQKFATAYGIKLSSLILISEEYTDMSDKGKSEQYVRRRMLDLINKMSEGLDEEE